MITFSMNEILWSVVSALIYGLIFALFICLVDILVKQLRLILRVPREIIFYDGKITETALKCEIISQKTSNVTNPKIDYKSILCGAIVFVKVMLFFLGCILAAYYALDGSFRLYFILISLLTNLCFAQIFKRLSDLLSRMFVGIYNIFIILVRLVLYPFRVIFGVFRRFVRKILDKILLFIPDGAPDILDKGIK